MRVKAIRDCFVGSYRKADEEFDYSGAKNTNLQPLDGAKWPSEKSTAKTSASGTVSTVKPDASAIQNLTAPASGDGDDEAKK